MLVNNVLVSKGFDANSVSGRARSSHGTARLRSAVGALKFRRPSLCGRSGSGLAHGSADSRQRYCANLGHRQDDETGTYTGGSPDGDGLVYMRARYYEPTTGRFASEDPGHFGTNWYTFCREDPINHVDANGNFEIDNAAGTWIQALLNIAGSIVGYYSAFFVTISLLQTMHPDFKPSADWLGELLGNFGSVATTAFTARINLGGGIEVANYMMKYGWKAFGIGFWIGALFGTYAAKQAWDLYYVDHFDDIKE